MDKKINDPFVVQALFLTKEQHDKIFDEANKIGESVNQYCLDGVSQDYDIALNNPLHCKIGELLATINFALFKRFNEVLSQEEEERRLDRIRYSFNVIFELLEKLEGFDVDCLITNALDSINVSCICQNNMTTDEYAKFIDAYYEKKRQFVKQK